MRIDLHTHSSESDGTDSPAELMEKAAAAGLDVLAITDHDTTAGWAQAERARPDGLAVIRGAEFSTAVDVGPYRMSVHLLGYLFDPDDPAVQAENARLVGERRRRGIAMVELMVADGIPISVERVLQIAGDAPLGRPHIGRALVEAGIVGSVTEAFERLVASRGPYYVGKRDADLRAAIRMVVAAGGAPVIAHPRARGADRALTPDLIAELAGLGLAGLEADHPDHDERQRAEMFALAADLDLVATGSSDYHGSNKQLVLGQCTTAPSALERLLARTSGAVGILGP